MDKSVSEILAECNTIFPELKESEDERIRKELIDFINHYRHNTDLTSEQAEWCKKALAYLERQKEQKPADNVSKEKYVKRFKALCDAYEIKLPNREYDIYHLCDDLSKLSIDSSKQQPAEWSEEDKLLIDAAIYWLKRRLAVEKASDISTRDCPLSMRKNIERLKSLRQRPHWKPSKEQMKALNDVANDGVLLDLFNDLLKLF